MVKKTEEKIEEKIENNIKHAEKAIENFDSLKIKEMDAETIFKEFNKLLDECIDMLSKDKFHVQEISLKQPRHITKHAKKS